MLRAIVGDDVRRVESIGRLPAHLLGEGLTMWNQLRRIARSAQRAAWGSGDTSSRQTTMASRSGADGAAAIAAAATGAPGSSRR